ncbi:MAG: hypothetical protein LUC17_04735, partial [Oscillospiraceae bacterium]|nr:hypothetical protein [Oscillospiraceae bacterium]
DEKTEEMRENAAPAGEPGRVWSIDPGAPAFAGMAESEAREGFLRDLYESERSGKILTGTVQAVEPVGEDYVAVIYYGGFRVEIPSGEFIKLRGTEETPERAAARRRREIDRRLGAEVDFIVQKTDRERRANIASRLAAMEIRQRSFKTEDEEGPGIRAGGLAEARVMAAGPRGITAEIFGAETLIRMGELSYDYLDRAEDRFSPGQRVVVRILKITRDPDTGVQVEASVKRAGKDPAREALKNVKEGGIYTGTVTHVSAGGVFLYLDARAVCHCRLPGRFKGQIARGDRCKARVTGKEEGRDMARGSILTVTPRDGKAGAP